jgi:hypothetical protein
MKELEALYLNSSHPIIALHPELKHGEQGREVYWYVKWVDIHLDVRYTNCCKTAVEAVAACAAGRERD